MTRRVGGRETTRPRAIWQMMRFGGDAMHYSAIVLSLLLFRWSRKKEAQQWKWEK
jgi:hypothetical protein